MWNLDLIHAHTIPWGLEGIHPVFKYSKNLFLWKTTYTLFLKYLSKEFAYNILENLSEYFKGRSASFESINFYEKNIFWIQISFSSSSKLYKEFFLKMIKSHTQLVKNNTDQRSKTSVLLMLGSFSWYHFIYLYTLKMVPGKRLKLVESTFISSALFTLLYVASGLDYLQYASC